MRSFFFLLFCLFACQLVAQQTTETQLPVTQLRAGADGTVATSQGGQVQWTAPSGTSGSGTTNRIPQWVGSTALGNSILTAITDGLELNAGTFLRWNPNNVSLPPSQRGAMGYLGNAFFGDRDGLGWSRFLQDGMSAGGDLAGTYPNPTIAPLSVAYNDLDFTGATNLWTSNGSNIYRNSGNVGIQVTSPTATLEIKEDLKINSPVNAARNFQLIVDNNGAGFIFDNHEVFRMPFNGVNSYLQINQKAALNRKYGIQLYSSGGVKNWTFGMDGIIGNDELGIYNATGNLIMHAKQNGAFKVGQVNVTAVDSAFMTVGALYHGIGSTLSSSIEIVGPPANTGTLEHSIAFRTIQNRGGLTKIAGRHFGSNNDGDMGLSFYVNNTANSIREVLRLEPNNLNVTFPESLTSVGIGTTSPSRKLHVVGDARITTIGAGTPVGIVGYEADGDLVQYPLASIPGDNLGDHIATEDVILLGNAIRNSAAGVPAIAVGLGPRLIDNEGNDFVFYQGGMHVPTRTTEPGGILAGRQSIYSKSFTEAGIDKVRLFTKEPIDYPNGGTFIGYKEAQIVTETDIYQRTRFLAADLNSITSSADPAYAITGLAVTGLPAGRYEYKATIYHSKQGAGGNVRSDFEFLIAGTHENITSKFHVEGEGFAPVRLANGVFTGTEYASTSIYQTTVILNIEFTADGGSITPELEAEISAGLNYFINIHEGSTATVRKL